MEACNDMFNYCAYEPRHVLSLIVYSNYRMRTIYTALLSRNSLERPTWIHYIEHDHCLMQSTCKVGNHDGNASFVEYSQL